MESAMITDPSHDPHQGDGDETVLPHHGRLLEALRSRQRNVCEAFVGTYYQGVYRFFLWLTNERESASDLTQETFAAFWASMDRIQTAQSVDLKAWLYGIARNRWRKWCRDSPVPDAPLEEALGLPDDAPGPEALAMAALEADEVARAVAELSPPFREALVLRVFEELSYRQIAAVLSISEELARWRTHRARQCLRVALEEMREKEKSGAA
jgi:RNA polymerase sigma-70 factor (ECF subfamily)